MVFDNIKVGDKVIYCPAWGNNAIATVTKVTPAGNFAIDKTGKTLWDKFGMKRGSDIWNRSHIIEYSEEYAKKVIEQNIMAKAVNMMQKRDKLNLTVEQAKAIICILEDNRSEDES